MLNPGAHGQDEQALAAASPCMDAPKHSLGTTGGENLPLALFHPSAFWGQSPGGKPTRKPVVGMDTFWSALGHWHSSRDNPAVLTCCGGHTSRSGGPGNPGTAHSSHTAHSSPLAHVSPVGNRMKGVRLQCPHLDTAETDPVQTRSGLLVGRQEREQAEPLGIAHSSPGLSSAFAGSFDHRETFTPNKLLSLLHFCSI